MLNKLVESGWRIESNDSSWRAVKHMPPHQGFQSSFAMASIDHLYDSRLEAVSQFLIIEHVEVIDDKSIHIRLMHRNVSIAGINELFSVFKEKFGIDMEGEPMEQSIIELLRLSEQWVRETSKENSK
jgi:hypothetical protein